MAKKSKPKARSARKLAGSQKKSKKSLPALLTPVQFEKRFLSLEKELEGRFLEMEKRLAQFSGGMKMQDTPNATKVSFDGLGVFKKNEICIDVSDHTLTVSAKNANSAFYKSISLPFLIVPDKAKPELKDGTLSITLPKYKEKIVRAKRVKV